MAKKDSAKQNAKKTIGGTQKEILDLRHELQSLRLEHAQFKLKNTTLITLTRKKLAVALTKQSMERKEQTHV